MNKQLEQQIYQRFPVRIDESVRVSIGRGFLVECDDGWYNLIYSLFEELEQLYIKNNADIKELSVHQIKQKFGQLRVYVSSEFEEETNSIIEKYENKSLEICEQCGRQASLNGDRFSRKTLCSACAEQKGFKAISKGE